MKLFCPQCDDWREVSVKDFEEIYPVKGEPVKIQAEVAVCHTCHNKVYCQELDDKNLNLAFLEYRQRHNLLSPAQITEIRKKYFLSQRSLAQLLEWGEITIHRYEKGAIQDPSHNEVLMFINDPQNMLRILNKNENLMQENAREKLRNRINELLDSSMPQEISNILAEYLGRNIAVDEYSGYAAFNIEKMKTMIMYIVRSEKTIFPTKLNKLLFYSDFLNCREYTKSISGSNYIHDHYGPVPSKFQLLLATMVEEDLLCMNEISFPDGATGLEYKVKSSFDDTVLSNEEKDVLDYVLDHFRRFNATQIKDFSHEEKGYKETHLKEHISYCFARELSLSFKQG